MTNRPEQLSGQHSRIRDAMRRAVNGEKVIQRQDSTTRQLMDLWIISTKLGMYDAADWMWKNADLEKEV